MLSCYCGQCGDCQLRKGGQLDLPIAKPKQNTTRADQILERFKEFHKANPQVWHLFKKFAFEVINAGFEHYSCRAVAHRIRWHTSIETRGEAVKINNNFTAYYARMFHVAFPRYDGFFRNRKLTTQNKPGHEVDVQVFDSGAPEGESRLQQELKILMNMGDDRGKDS